MGLGQRSISHFLLYGEFYKCGPVKVGVDDFLLYIAALQHGFCHYSEGAELLAGAGGYLDCIAIERRLHWFKLDFLAVDTETRKDVCHDCLHVKE